MSGRRPLADGVPCGAVRCFVWWRAIQGQQPAGMQRRRLLMVKATDRGKRRGSNKKSGKSSGTPGALLGHGLRLILLSL
jgi:hypothetical protein